MNGPAFENSKQKESIPSSQKDSQLIQKKALPVFESGESHSNQIPPIVHEVLKSPGKPLDAETRAFFEPRFGHDFNSVSIYSDSQSDEAAEAINALAFTVGQKIVFGAGQYLPGTDKGKQLLAHELSHVVQQQLGSSLVSEGQDTELEKDAEASALQISIGTPVSIIRSGRLGSLQRQESLLSPLPQSKMGTSESNPARLRQLRELLVQITQETELSIYFRSQLQILPPVSSVSNESIDTELNESRIRLISLLERRILLLGQEINSLHERIGPFPVSRVGGPRELESLGNDLNQRERELNEHQLQLRSLRLWQTRQNIQVVQQEVEQINRDILTLPPQNPEAPTSDMTDPHARELMQRRTVLELRQRELAASMTSQATRYRQADPRWGSKRYGTSSNCTNIAAAGCGPTSMAILLNYLFQEDPEIVAGGDLEFIKPPETANYAATHGRVCNNGTAGDTMVTNVHTQWPGFRGTRISLEQASTALRSGNLVIFLCKSCTGHKTSGGNYTYGGHFMVLNGVNQDSTVFNVLDPAGANIATISRIELQNHTNGFWTVERK